MLHNLYVRTSSQTYNIFALDDDQVKKICQFYKRGENSITLSGKKYQFHEMLEFKVFTYELTEPWEKTVNYYLNNIHFRKMRKGQDGYFLPTTILRKMGRNKTNDLVGDMEFGQEKVRSEPFQHTSHFVSDSRLGELSSISSKAFDLSRLIQLCKEINSNYSNQNFLSVGMIGRTIINHIPPILGLRSFDQVAANYGGPKEHRSFKKNMNHLNDSLKNIADSILHQPIRKKEILPNEIQIDFRQDLDVLLGEIVRVLMTTES